MSQARADQSSAEPHVVYSAENMPALAAADLVAGIRRHELWLGFAIFDIRQRFRRSMLGPLWLTLSTGVMVGALSLVFGTLFQQDIGGLMPHLAVGLVFWGLISSVVLEACASFTIAEGYIRSVPMPTSVHVYRMFARNVITWSFNIVIYVFVWLIFLRSASWEYLLFFPGFALLLANLVWVAFVAAILSTRYRDIPQVIASVIQVVFFLTPVFWSIESLPSRPAFVSLNPIYHLLEIVRRPLLGQAPAASSWLIACGLLVVGAPTAFLLYRRAFPRIPYWV